MLESSEILMPPRVVIKGDANNLDLDGGAQNFAGEVYGNISQETKTQLTSTDSKVHGSRKFTREIYGDK